MQWAIWVSHFLILKHIFLWFCNMYFSSHLYFFDSVICISLLLSLVLCGCWSIVCAFMYHVCIGLSWHCIRWRKHSGKKQYDAVVPVGYFTIQQIHTHVLIRRWDIYYIYHEWEFFQIQQMHAHRYFGQGYVLGCTCVIHIISVTFVFSKDVYYLSTYWYYIGMVYYIYGIFCNTSALLG